MFQASFRRERKIVDICHKVKVAGVENLTLCQMSRGIKNLIVKGGGCLFVLGVCSWQHTQWHRKYTELFKEIYLDFRYCNSAMLDFSGRWIIWLGELYLLKGISSEPTN